MLEDLGILGNTIVLLAAILALDKSSDLTIDNSVKIAEITGLGATTIGFLLVGFSTSLPELSVSVFAATNPDSIGVAIGNVLGSNIVNVCLIMGLCFLILALKKDTSSNNNISIGEARNLYFGLFIASLIPLALIYIGYASNIIGAILVTIFVLYNIQIFKPRRNEEKYNPGGNGRTNNAINKSLLSQPLILQSI
ncbi:MAG: hypothetical protein QXU67_06790 [Candidatus Bathyarchaeia archaeon]